MTAKEKAAHGAGTPGRQETATFCRAPALQGNSTTPQPQKQGLIESMLLKGEENAITSSELVRLTGFKSVRELQNEIAREREAGSLILSTCRGGGGYFRPAPGEAGKQEIAAFVSTLASRAIGTFRALKSAKRELKTLDGQITFDQIEAALMAVVNAHDDGDR